MFYQPADVHVTLVAFRYKLFCAAYILLNTDGAFIDILPTVITLANAEDLPAHGEAMSARLRTCHELASMVTAACRFTTFNTLWRATNSSRGIA